MIQITLTDEVKFHIDGLSDSDYHMIYESMKLPKAGSFMTVAYQMKLDDGMESLMTEDGYGYQFFLNDVVDMLEELGYTDNVDIVDDRLSLPDLPTEHIDENYLIDELGFALRDHQVTGVNKVITNRCGMLDFATTAGKSFLCAAVSKYFEDHLKTLLVVPNVKLAKQTKADYEKVGLDVVFIDPTKHKTGQSRLETIRKHRHIIVTSSLLLNILDYEDEADDHVITGQPFVLLYDEAHRFGDRMFEVFKYELSNCPVRVGMTGTVPKDKLKFAKICGSLNGEILDDVKGHELIKKNYASDLFIDMVVLLNQEVEQLATQAAVKRDDWSWDKEVRFYNSKPVAATVLAILQELEPKNTLVLCRPELGNHLAELLNTSMITKDTPNNIRDTLFDEFDAGDSVLRLASFDTSGTGISKNNIQRVVLIDAGKNETWFIQGIGRGIRLDGKENFCEILDISCNTLYAKRHRKTRQKIYKEQKYPFGTEVKIEME